MNNLTLFYQSQEVESDNDSYLNDTIIQFIFIQGLRLTIRGSLHSYYSYLKSNVINIYNNSTLQTFVNRTTRTYYFKTLFITRLENRATSINHHRRQKLTKLT